jgi:hypothetical protein
MDWQSVVEYGAKLSSFPGFDTVIAGAFGAFFGAWGAHAIISRNQKKQALIKEVNSINAALILCFSISNSFISLKRQHVRPMFIRYNQVKEDYSNFLLRRKTNNGVSPLVFTLQADLQTLSMVRVPTEILEREVFENISMHGRGLVAAVQLVNAIDGVDKAIEYRNELIGEIRQRSPYPAKELTELYLGLSNEDGAIDERYRSGVEEIHRQTDDCIFFSLILADDLSLHGTKLRRRKAWVLWSRLPKLTKIDWSIAEDADLLPSRNQYENWLRGFKEQKTKLERIKCWFRSKLGSKSCG